MRALGGLHAGCVVILVDMKRPLTVTEFARMGSKAQLATYSREQLKQWGKMGDRPKGSKDTKPRRPRLDRKRKSTPRS